jgi:hypothetical protein
MKNKYPQAAIFLIVLAVLIAGCSSQPEEPVKIMITFDGEECAYTGPKELPPGEYPFFFDDLSKKDYNFFVFFLGDNHTYQDLSEYQSGPGERFIMPSWAHPTNKFFSAEEETDILILDTIGEYAITIWDWPKNTEIYLCPPIEVK